MANDTLPRCGHCKKIESDYHQAAERLHDLQIEVNSLAHSGLVDTLLVTVFVGEI
jgi:hypothetical protein